MLLALAVVPGLVRSWTVGRLLVREDTRSQAGRWIARNVPRDVPVVLLGAPEAEPQLTENAASIRRRIGYVHRRYGEVAGDVVSIPYRMFLESATVEESNAAYSVYRNPAPGELPPGPLCVVYPAHPLLGDAVPALSDLALEATQGTTLTLCLSLAEAVPARAFERIDAFFVPMSHLAGVIRPGPDLRIELRAPRRP